MIQLLKGDCLDVLPGIPSGIVNAVIADIPYGTTKCKWDSVIDLDLMWKELKRIIKPDGVIVLFAQTPFDKVLGASNLSMLRHEWIWEKGNATGFLNAKKMPLKAHENVLVFYNRLPTYNPQFTHGHKRKTATRRGVNSQCYGKSFETTTYDSTSRYPRSVLRFSSDKQKCNYHPTQKPLEAIEYFIKTYTNEGDLIVDHTMGSGTVGVGCKNLNRDFIGIEKYSDIFETAVYRVKNA